MVQQGPASFDEASAQFHHALDIDSVDAVAWRSLGLLESLRGNWRSAAVDYGHVVLAMPDNLDANDGLARALLRLDEPDAAKRYVDKVGTGDIELLWTLGDVLVQHNRGPEALRYLQIAAGSGKP